MDFDEIPLDWLEPSMFLEIKPNYVNLGVLPWPEKCLIVGAKLAAGTIAAGAVVEVTRADEAIALFGRGSIGSAMVAAFRKANTTTPLFVMALPDAGASVKATGTFTFAGTVTTASVLRFKVGNRQIRITALPTDDAAALATKLAAAITADLDMVVTAAAAAAVVTCTARHGGEVGNEIDLRVDLFAGTLPAGLTVTVVQMANGAGNPLVQAALDILTNSWFTKLVHPWSDATNMVATAEWLRVRYLATSKMDCHGFVFKRGTYGQLGTFGNLTNCPFLSVGGLKGSPTPAYEIAAAVCGLAAFHLTNDPARQLRSLVIPGAVAPDDVDQFTDPECDQLLRAGISTFNATSDGSLTISRLITTYKKSALDVPDRAWLDIMTPVTMSRIRYDWSAYMALTYPRSKLVDDDSTGAFASRHDDDEDPGTAVVTPKRILASWAGRCALYASKVWIESVEATIKKSRFVRSSSDRNRVEGKQHVRVVGNLMVLAGSLEFQA